MSPIHARRLLALAAIASLGWGCLDTGPDSPAGNEGRVAIDVAPLSLPDIVDASYTITVRNGALDVVWSRTITSSQFGDGAGSVSYVGPCDADDSPNTIELEVVSLSDADGPLINGVDFVNPAPVGSPLSLSRACVADEDTSVVFEITMARAAQQGFFDVAVEFNNIFCSAKLDCLNQDDEPLRLLFDGTERERTVVVGLACTGDLAAGGETWLYRDDVNVTCDNGSALVNAGAGPGNLSEGAGITSTGTAPLFGAAVHQGAEQLGFNKRYWNVLLGLADTATGCVVTTQATASPDALDGGGPYTTAAGTTWPVITWDVNVTAAGTGALACTTHPVNGVAPNDGVATGYADPDAPEPFAYVYGPDAASPLCVAGQTDCALASCNAILLGGFGSTDGTYAIDPDGPNAGNSAFDVYCDMTTDDGGWTLLATLRSTNSGGTANWPSWTQDWWTIVHGTPTDPSVAFSNHDMRLFRALIAPTSVVRVSSPAAAVSRYQFNMTATDWDLWNAMRTVSAVRLIGPFGSPTSTQVSRSLDLSGAVTAGLNGHWDSGYFYLGTATSGGDVDSEGLGARYHVATNAAPSYGYVGGVRQSAVWHLWLR